MYANLSGEEIKKVQNLEKELGVYILATPKFKSLSKEDMDAVADLEHKLGAVLIAYDA